MEQEQRSREEKYCTYETTYEERTREYQVCVPVDGSSGPALRTVCDTVWEDRTRANTP